MKQISFFLFFFLLSTTDVRADINKDFEIWKTNFKKIALQNNISEDTFNITMSNTKFLSDVIKYDRYQPEFYEDTKTYISKRTSSKKVSVGKKFYKKNSKLINSIEKTFDIEKELLLSLMGIETNFGTYVGKMDILSSLSTLSFDKRRSEFFTNELLILLRLIETKKINYKTLLEQSQNSNNEGCFVATMVYGDYNHPKVIQLRKFRDYVLKKYYIGRLFIKSYYKISPSFVKVFKNHKLIKKLFRYIIDLFLKA